MKKKLVILAIICLVLFIFRDSIIRYYFISKIEYVDYDEYILIDYLNGKKNKATYVGADFMIVLEYNLENESIENVVVYDYDKRIKHEYNIEKEDLKKNGNSEDRPINLNNEYLLELLHSKAKVKFKGIEEIGNRKNYVLEFIPVKNHIITVCIDKNLLYTVIKKENYLELDKDKNIIYNYELDLELKYKNIFEDYIN